jgi:hypothetical protein
MPNLRSILSLAAILTGAACNGSQAVSADDDRPPGGDVITPFPIDRGDDGPQTPGSYKGLPLRLADNAASSVTPVGGVIGVVCVGMSNGRQECDDFIQRVRNEYANEVNPAVRVVNCAVGGHAIERWIDPAYDGTLWDRCASVVLPQAGVSVNQVRVIWHKAANQFTTSGNSVLPTYPSAGSDYENFRANLTKFAARVTTKFPAVQAIYASSRSYGGFANSASRGEPLSYEEGHALNTWLQANTKVSGVWYGWGAYLWAPSCASSVTNASNVCYNRDDYVEDGVHPSPAGEAKVSRMLHSRFLKESWYRR